MSKPIAPGLTTPSSATTRAGTRIPRFASAGISQRYGPRRSSLRDSAPRFVVARIRQRALARPREPRDRDGDAEDARELGDAEGPEPEAVEPDGLDEEAADGIEAEVREEEPARLAREPAA